PAEEFALSPQRLRLLSFAARVWGFLAPDSENNKDTNSRAKAGPASRCTPAVWRFALAKTRCRLHPGRCPLYARTAKIALFQSATGLAAQERCFVRRRSFASCGILRHHVNRESSDPSNGQL